MVLFSLALMGVLTVLLGPVDHPQLLKYLYLIDDVAAEILTNQTNAFTHFIGVYTAGSTEPVLNNKLIVCAAELTVGVS